MKFSGETHMQKQNPERIWSKVKRNIGIKGREKRTMTERGGERERDNWMRKRIWIEEKSTEKKLEC